MTRGPKGERRPADVIGDAVKVMRIATGEGAETLEGADKDQVAREMGRQAQPPALPA